MSAEGLRTFTFNGIKKPYLIPLFGFNREAWATIERQYQDIPGRAGVYMRNKRIVKQRTIPIPVLIHDPDMDYQKLKEDLATWLIHDEPKELILEDEPNRIYYAVVEGGFSPEDIVSFGKGTINFVCPDPYKYGYEETLPLGDYQIINEGNVESQPFLTCDFTGSSTDYEITCNGKTMKVIWNFQDNDVLVIDTAKRKVLINGLVKMTALDLSSEWFELAPGENTIEYGTNADVSITFKPMWM